MTLASRLAKIARIAAKIAAGVAAFVLLLVLACFILNSFDVPLSDQAKALLTPPPNPYAPTDNLYLAMAGLDGAGERPIVEMGQEKIDAYNVAFDAMLLDPQLPLEFSKKWESAKLPFSGNLSLGPQRTTSIWTDVKDQRQDITALLAANQKLYRRYLTLHDLHGYFETARPSQFAPLVFVPQPLRILFLADVANRVQTGTLQQQRQARGDLQQDVQMWRTILKGSGTLVSKLVAAASLHADLILGADLIADPNSDLDSLDDELVPMLLPFDLKDYRIGNAFIAEFRGTAPLFKTITEANAPAGSRSISWPERESNAFQAHFFKLDATENMSAANAAQWAALADSEPSDFYRNRDLARDWLKNNEPHFSPTFLYNPIGKILMLLAVRQYDSYLLRVYDIAAFQRLVYLAFQLKRQHIAIPDVAAFLKAHPEWSTHPVDGKPFRWNAATGELAVNALGEHPQGQRFAVILQ